MNRILATIACLLCLYVAPTALAQQEQPTLESALSLLDDGIAQLEARDPNADATITRAASSLQAVIDEQQLHTPAAYHALGNAYALIDDYGHAVLAYRRGLEINPRDQRLRDSLDFAREQVQISVEPSTGNRIRSILTAWRGFVPRSWFWSGFVSLFLLGWLLLTARVVFNLPTPVRTGALWCFGLCLLPLLALSYEWKINRGSDLIVITQANVLAMSGPDDSVYDPVYSEPLDAGVEGRLEESRDEWGRLRLIDGSECWVPMDTLEFVSPKHHSQ
jgi:tetratricopeptide (TPR) repeat protein